MDSDEAFQDLFTDDLVISVIEKLVSVKVGSTKFITEDNTKNGQIPRYVDEVSKVISSFLKMLRNELAEGRYDEKFLCALTWAFYPQADLHKNFYKLCKEDLEKRYTEHQDWRDKDKLSTRKPNNRVDVRVKVDVDNPNSKARGWISRRINKIENREDPNSKQRRKGEDQDRRLEIVFPELP